jgi:hypothetical protein
MTSTTQPARPFTTLEMDSCEGMEMAQFCILDTVDIFIDNMN